MLKVLKILAESEGNTGEEVTELYNKDAQEEIHHKEMASILRYADDYGLMQKKVKVSDGGPVLLWKNTTSYAS